MEPLEAIFPCSSDTSQFVMRRHRELLRLHDELATGGVKRLRTAAQIMAVALAYFWGHI